MSRIICCCITLVLLLTGPASAQWTARYQQDPLFNFQGVHFPTSAVGYAVGASGAIFKTVDGGFTWTAETSPTSSTLNSVFFKSATEGWAVGAAGTVIYTTDGTNWSVHSQSPLTGDGLLTISFQGDAGWIGGGRSNYGEIWRTTDNGVTWTSVLADGDAVSGISFTSALDGVAAIDRQGIRYTSDGGATWDTATVNRGPYPYSRADLEAIKMVNDTLGIATGWGSMVAAQPTTIVITTDGGQTWNVPNTNYHWEMYGYGYGIAVFDDGEILITGGGSGTAGYILHSDDALNWTRRSVITGETLRGIAAVPGTDRCVAVGQGGLIALSTDRGMTWDYRTTPIFGFNGFQLIRSRGSAVYAAGDLGAFCKVTPDGSGYDLAFQTISPTKQFAEILYDMAIVPTADGIGYVIYLCGGYQSLYKSADGGATWTMLSHTFGTTDRFRAMHWFDVDNGIIVGTRGGRDAMYVTDDGGETLTEVWYNVTYRDLNAISFAPGNPLIGVMGGNYGPQTSPYYISLHYTTDGGSTWTLASTDITPTNGNIWKVWMTSSTTGWAVGSSGIVAKTTDGGATWTQQASGTTNQLNDVYFDHPKLGWIAGHANTALRTADGGLTWTDIAPSTPPAGTPNAMSIYFQGSQGVLWLGGRDFFLLTSTDAALTDAGTPPSLPFVLNQNYPNPFNPSTTINFSLGRDGFVRLNVYDVAGRQVAKVIEKEMKAGDHSISFNASGLASGVYFYRLKTDDQEQTRKMILLR